MFPWEDLPEIEFEHRIRGHGTLVGTDRELRVPAFTVRRPKYGTSESWDFLAHPDATHTEIRSATGDLQETLRLDAETDRGEAIRIPEIHVQWFTHRRVEGFCFEIEIGPESLPGVPDRQFLLVSFSSTAIARPEIPLPTLTPKGEIKELSSRHRNEPFRISTPLGEGSFSLQYKWEDALVAEEKVPVRVPRPRLFLEVEEEQRETTPLSLARSLEDSLPTFCRLLSFLSRQDVTWMHTLVGSRREEGEDPFPPKESQLWKATGPDRSTTLEPLVVPGRMSAKDLGTLLGTFRGLEYRDSIFHAIGFLIGSISERHAEARLINAWTALEATVSGYCHSQGLEFIVESDQHNSLRQRVKTVIAEWVDKNELIRGDQEEDVRNSLQGKMAGPHTRRRAFPDRVRDAVLDSGAHWRDLWPEETRLRRAIRDGYSRRSTLIHRARRSDDLPTPVDTYRIHALTERIIFHLLGGDRNWINPRAYEHARGVENYPV